MLKVARKRKRTPLVADRHPQGDYSNMKTRRFKHRALASETFIA